jgi:hypothetical protein
MFALVALTLLIGAPPLTVPPAWTAKEVDAVWILSPPDAPANDFAHLEIYPSERGTASTWVRAAWAALKKPYTDVHDQFEDKVSPEQREVSTASGFMADGTGEYVYAVLWAISDGEAVQPVLFVGGSKASYEKYAGTAAGAIASLPFPGPAAKTTFASRRHLYREPKAAAIAAGAGTPAPGGAAAAPAPKGKAERVPDSSFKNGEPKGIFVGTSLLTGKAICLMFLSGGRITRAIPKGGLEDFYWEQHKSENGGNCGTWSISGDTLTVTWGDGGVNKGPLKATANGVEFYGKRYTRPEKVDVARLAGRWESARTVGALTVTHTLDIGAGGAFHWVMGSGGVVAGRAVASTGRDLRGTLTMRGTTATFRGDDGSVLTYYLHRVPGDEVVTAFSVGGDMFWKQEK